MTVYLHIGFPKTATTSLQFAFRENRQALALAGICYPLIDDDFKQRYLKLYDIKSNGDGAQALTTSVQEMISVAKSSHCQHTILSCEELTNFMMMQYDAKNIRRLRDDISRISNDIKIVAYVRNPSDFYLSILQEKLKRHAGVIDPYTFQTDFAKTIRLYEDVFETKAIVREFSPRKMRNGDIVADFLHATGLDHVNIDDWNVSKTNESVSPEVLFVLDLARREIEDSDNALKYEFSESEMLWRRLNRISQEFTQPRKPLLFETIKNTICEANAEDAKALKDRYGIDFDEGKSSPSEPKTSSEFEISKIQSLMDVDVDQSFFIWSKLTHRAIQEILSMRNRAKVAQNG